MPASCCTLCVITSSSQLALSPFVPALRGTSTSASVPPRLTSPAPSLQPPCWPDGTTRPHVSFLYTLVPDAVCLGRLLNVYGGLLERQPSFVHLAREILRAVCDVDAMTTCDLNVVSTAKQYAYVQFTIRPQQQQLQLLQQQKLVLCAWRLTLLADGTLFRVSIRSSLN